jgi:autotransporter-associated beta strand protein
MHSAASLLFVASAHQATSRVNISSGSPQLSALRFAGRFRAPTAVFAVAVVCSIALFPLTSLAQTATGATWDNTGTEWTSGTSWVGDNGPTNDNTLVGNIATFSNAAAGFNTVNLSGARGIYGLVFVSGANAYTFTGSALTVGNAGGISNASANLQTFSNKIINNGGTAIYGSYGGGSLIFAGGIDLTTSSSSASRTVTLGGSGDITVSGAIAAGGTSTGGNILVTNTGLTILSGNNTYFGTTTVNNGARLRLGSATALGATNGGTIISSGGALDLNGQAIGAEALTISGGGVSSSGVIFNSSASAASWSGNIAPTADSTIKVTNGSITLSGGININNTAASSRTLTLDGAGGLILSGNISNSFAGSTGNIAVAATASNVTLSGSNSYSGTTTLNSGGGVNINSAYAISTNTFIISSASGAAFLNNTSGGAITNLGNNNITLGDGITFGTSGSTSANSLNLGTGTVTASSSRAITVAGTGVTLGLGTLDSTSTSSGRTFTANGAGNTLSLAGWKIQSGSTANVTAKLAGSANWMITGPIVNGNAFSNGVQIDATGLTTFGGDNTYDGTTIVSSGATLRITSATGLGSTNTGTTVSTGGQLQMSGGITVSAGEALSLSGTNGDTASLRNISGANTYNGAITFNTGTNRIDSDAGTLTLSSFASTVVSNRWLLVGGAGNTIFTGRVTGNNSGSLVKDGAGTLTLANTNNEVGPQGVVLINNGTLALGTNNALGATRAVAVNGGTLDISTFNNTVGAVTLTNGTISGSSGVLSGTSYAVENGTISAILGGSGTLTKSGNGTVTLSAANSYDGATTVSAGALTISNGSALGSATGGATVAAGAALQLQGGITVDGETLGLSGTNGDTASLRNISGNNTYNGAVSFSSGTNRIDSDAGLLTLSSFANSLTSTKALLVGGAGNTTFSGRFTGSTTGTLTKDGAGTLTLSATNFDIAGGVIVNAGTLALGTNDALGATRAITVNNATFDLGSYSNTMGAVTVTNGGRITGITGTLTASSISSVAVGKTNTISANLAGSGGLALTGNTNTTVLSGSNSYSGDTTLQTSASTNMRLRVTTTNALSSNSSLIGSTSADRIPTLELAAAGDYRMQNFKGGNMIFVATNGAATLSFTNTSVTNLMTGGDRSFYATNVDVSFAGALQVSATTADKEFRFFGNGDYTFDGSILTTNNTFTSSLVVGTTGTVTLNASNNYNGTTMVNSNATLLLGNNNALGTTNSGTTVLSGGALDLGGSAISDEALSVEGSGVSSGGAIKNSSATAASFSGAVTLTAATTIAATNGNITLSGAIGQDTGSRNLTKTGSSTLTLSGTSANTYLGRTTVSGGVLALNKTAGVNAIAGAVSVGSGAQLLLSANNQVADTSAITLSGGTITRASGVSETFGNLNVTVASTLNFGSGTAGSLGFGTYSRDTESALLTVQNFFQGNSLVFGQDLVTSGYIASSSSGSYDNGYFAFADGFTTNWDSGTSTFTITAIPEPSTYVAAIALLGLMLWPSRRRLLKDAKSILGLRAPARDRLRGPDAV